MPGLPFHRPLLAALLTVVALLPAQRALAEAPVTVVATTGMITDAAREVGGDLVDVEALMGAGVDPHSYRQTRTDIVAMSNADLVLWHGLYLEAQLEEFLLELGETGNVVAVAESLPPNVLIGSEDYEGRFDPHVWMNPNLWSRVVLTVRDALAETPSRGPEVSTPMPRPISRKTGRRCRNTKTAVLSSVPAESRVLLTSHDAFNYFGSAYGFEVFGIQGISTEARPG